MKNKKMLNRSEFVIIFFGLFGLGNVEALIQEGFAKVFGSTGSITNVRTTQLLNQLCNESQDENITRRDACYGCFFRASQRASGYPMLLSMAECADKYLDNTEYGHCRNYLWNATRDANVRGNPATIYCTFLECIRQVNKDTLDALSALRVAKNGRSKGKLISKKENSDWILTMRRYASALRPICIVRTFNQNLNTIRSCVGEALRSFEDFRLNDNNLSRLFVNTTACILAKTRCSITNPITGAYRQDADITTKLQITSVNAILVNSDYDINIVQLPFGHGVIDECAKYRNIKQANWPSVQCLPSSGFY